MRKIKLLINDFGGYPFPMQLARHLAGIDYEIVYTFCESLVTTPQAIDSVNGTAHVSNASRLNVVPIRLKAPFNKYAWIQRWSQEREYGRRISELIGQIEPTIVLSANTPLDAMTMIHRAARRCDAKHVFWLQDILGLAAKKILDQKLPVVGGMIGDQYIRKEQQLLKKVDQVILISEDFRDVMKQWRLKAEKAVVIENWAPLEDLPVLSRNNVWSAARGFDGKFVFLYSGTLSLKHNPKILAKLAQHIGPQNGVVVVRSQGLGADWLREAKSSQSIENLIVEPFGPYRDTAMAFASADVLVGLLEPEASEFSVPSKVLAYLCAGRPLLLNMPPRNRSACIVSQEQAGFVVEPGRDEDFLQFADFLISNPDAGKEMGRRARQFAEKAFNIQEIGSKFDILFQSLIR